MIVSDVGDSERLLNDSLQVEWAKVQARKQRWEEEVLLIQEEMRRVVMFFEWKAQWWRSRAHCRSDADDGIIHGVVAYAEKQAHFCESFAQSCVGVWLLLLKSKGAAPDWDAYSLMTAKVDVPFADGAGDGDEETDGESQRDDDNDDLYSDLVDLDN